MVKVKSSRWLGIVGVALVAAFAAPGTAQAIGPDAAACAGNRAALLIRVHGLKNREGLIRVSTYVATDADWLAKGRYVRRIDVAVPRAGEPHVCVALPRAGEYGVAVLHDRNGDHHISIFKDGGGFSNNPSFGFTKPKADAVAFAAGAGLTTVDIDVKYL